MTRADVYGRLARGQASGAICSASE